MTLAQEVERWDTAALSVLLQAAAAGATSPEQRVTVLSAAYDAFSMGDAPVRSLTVESEFVAFLTEEGTSALNGN